MGNLKMRNKLLIIFLFISIVPLLFAEYVYYDHTMKTLEKELGENAVDISLQVQGNIDSFVQEMETNVDMFIRFNIDVQKFLTLERLSDDPKEIQSLLKTRELFASIGNIRGNLKGIFLVNDQGLTVYEAAKGILKYNYQFSQQSWFQSIHLLSTPKFQVLTEHSQDYVSGEPVLTLSNRIKYFPSLKEKGTLLIDFSPSILEHMIQNTDTAGKGFTFMITEKGEPVPARNGYPRSLINEIFMQQIANGNSSHFSMKHEDKQILVGYSISKTTGWRIVHVYPIDQVAEAFKAAKLKLLMIIIVAVSFIIPVSIFFSRTITRPISEMEKVMREVEKGNFSIEIPVRQRDEIGRLGRRFNRMLVELKRLKEEVYVTRIRQYRSEILRKDAQIHALQSQINPHFLYNTLNTITCIGEIYEVPDVVAVSNSLSEMFKYSTSNQQYATLENELKHVMAFLSITQVRFPDKINILILVPAELLNLKVVRLIIQPIVENAYIHGIAPREEGGSIVIHAEEHQNELFIHIDDDGVGMEETSIVSMQEMLDHSNSVGEQGIGMMNVQQRLKLHYMEQAGLSIACRPGCGIRVTIRMPAINEDNML